MRVFANGDPRWDFAVTNVFIQKDMLMQEDMLI